MANQLEDLTGRLFGRLTAIRRAPNDKNRNTRWECQCSCGSKRNVQAGALKAGIVVSCGCLKAERLRTFGLSKHPLWWTYKNMLRRCYNKHDPAFHRYGGRGIYVCQRWINSPQSFFDDMGPKPAGSQIERINNDGPYSTENCRWDTPLQQSNNRRSNRFITYAGKKQTVMQWSRETGINRRTIEQRLNKGLPMSEVLNPVKRRLYLFLR